MTPTDVTVIVVNWNGERYLDRCLGALAAQTRPPHRVIVVDNASADASVRIVRERFPQFDLVEAGDNLGFAAANNRAVHMADSAWIATLNPDAFPEPDWLERLLAAANRHPEYASFACRMVMDRSDILPSPGHAAPLHDESPGEPGSHNSEPAPPPCGRAACCAMNHPVRQTPTPGTAALGERLDGEGDVYHVSGLAWRLHHGLPVDESEMGETEVFSPCAGAALYRRDAFLDAGGFDEDYFCYFEDVDLGFRLRLLGHRCLYVPDARVVHVGSGLTGRRSDFAIYHGHRNLVWTYVKGMPPLLFWCCLPLHLALNLFTLVCFALQGRGRVILRAKRDALKGLPNAWRKRRTIQARRRCATADLWRVMDKGLNRGIASLPAAPEPNAAPPRILILSHGKSGSTALYFRILKGLAGAEGIFEPRDDAAIRPHLDSTRPLVAKALLPDALGILDELMSNFSTRILLVRDPRDVLVSALLYTGTREFLWKRPEAAIQAALMLLDRKRIDPPRVTLTALFEAIWGEGAVESVCRDIQGLSGLFIGLADREPPPAICRYEDFIAGRSQELEDRLGFSLSADTEVDEGYRRVARTRGTGDWRNWFCPEDIETFRPLFMDYMQRFGYDTEDWALSPSPHIEARHSTEYVESLIAECRRDAGHPAR